MPFVWEIAELVSANSAHPAVIFDGKQEGGKVGFRGSSAAAPTTMPRWLASERKRQPGDRTGGEMLTLLRVLKVDFDLVLVLELTVYSTAIKSRSDLDRPQLCLILAA